MNKIYCTKPIGYQFIEDQKGSIYLGKDISQEWESGDSKLALRVKFIGLFLLNATFAFPFRLGYVLTDLLTGQFARRGSKKGRIAFHAKALKNISEGRNVKGNLRVRQAMEITKELVVTIAKTILYPLVNIALASVALFGLVAPYHGRYFYSKVEEKFLIGNAVIGNFTAPCMQPKSIWKKKNLYDDKKCAANQALQFNNYVKEHAVYFKDENVKKSLEGNSLFKKEVVEKYIAQVGEGIKKGKDKRKYFKEFFAS